MNKAIVWIVKEQMIRDATGSGAMNYEPAMSYGDIKFITQSDMPLYPGSGVQVNWNRDVDVFTAMYNPNTDFIIATGQPTAIFTVGYLLGRAGKTPRYLVWRREDNQYRVLNFQ